MSYAIINEHEKTYYGKNPWQKESTMKAGIHPTYQKATIVCAQCGNEFEAGSVLDSIKVDTCSNCHPFYTGKQNVVQADGRVDRFMKRVETAQDKAKEIEKIEAERAKRQAEREALEASEE
jgi:large subunit ribosomal protein L31